MRERTFDEMVSYFNQRVADMDIPMQYKMELLGMVVALGLEYDKAIRGGTWKGEQTDEC